MLVKILELVKFISATNVTSHKLSCYLLFFWKLCSFIMAHVNQEILIFLNFDSLTKLTGYQKIYIDPRYLYAYFFKHFLK